MTTNWLKALYLGKELSDEEYKDIPNYRFELHCHVLYKNLQVRKIAQHNVESVVSPKANVLFQTSRDIKETLQAMNCVMTNPLLFIVSQAGSILGMGIVGPLIGLAKGRSFAAMKTYSVKVNIFTYS